VLSQLSYIPKGISSLEIVIVWPATSRSGTSGG
jgi:hypothetical protein